MEAFLGIQTSFHNIELSLQMQFICEWVDAHICMSDNIKDPIILLNMTMNELSVSKRKL